MGRGWPFCFVVGAIGFQVAAGAQHAAHVVPSIPQALLERSVPIRTGIGEAHDDAGTKSRDAQAFYDQGLAYLHSFVWIEAARSFHQALEHDPNLALAHVGLSYAYIELSKPAQAKQAMMSAQAVAPKAGDLSAEARSAKVDHERRHIEARALQMAAEDAPRDVARL